MSITNDEEPFINSLAAIENGAILQEDPPIPKQRSFTLYLMLSLGLLLFALAVYLYFYPALDAPHTYFDGERFVSGTLHWQTLCYLGAVVSAFPVYHLIKGSHKIKKRWPL